MMISEVSIRRPVLASMAILSLVVFGVVAWFTIGVDLFPDVDFPIVTVTVVYEGADPETVEQDVTDKIEEAVNTIAGIKSLRSESVEGLSQVFIEFELEEDIDVVSQEVRDKVSRVRGDLPIKIESPMIEKMDPDSMPIIQVALSGNVPIRDLSEYADNVVKPRLENAFGVGSVKLVGDREREIRIWLRTEDLQSHDISARNVLDRLREENVEPPGGRVETSSREMIVKTKGKMESVAAFRDIIIASRDEGPVRLGDIAWVEDGVEDRRSLARLGGKTAVALLVRRQTGENMLAVASAVKERLAEVKTELPPGYQLDLVQDLSVFVQNSVNEAQGELLRGGFLAVCVILFFLRSFRGAFVAGITIPATVISTFAFMNAMGFTMNMMSLLALTISVGMVIDDSIVVLENTYRHMEEGMTRFQAAITAMREIGFAVVATSLAIVAVFVPVAFMDGIVGRFFYEFGLTVTFAVIVSTIIAVTLSPMLCSRVLKISAKHGRFYHLTEGIFNWLEKSYGRILHIALRFRWVALGMAVAFFMCSLPIGMCLVGWEFVPVADEGEFNIQVEAPIGTSLSGTESVLAEIERRVKKLPGVETTFSTIGSGAEERVYSGTVTVRLAEKPLRNVSQFDVMKMARGRLANLHHLKLSVEPIPRISGGGMRSATIQYQLQGENLENLAQTAEGLIADLKKIDGFVDLASTFDDGKPEVSIKPDYDRAAEMGIATRDLGDAIRTLIGGEDVSTYEEGGETYDIRVRLVATDRDRPESILDVPVRTDSGKWIGLHNIVDVKETVGPVQIDRKDRMRQVTIMGNLDHSKTLGSAQTDIDNLVKQKGLPAGVEASYGGDAEMMAESNANMAFSLMLAVILIYMVLAAQFESLIHPFTVMLSLPLSVVGALGLLAITGRTGNIFSLIGIIMLMGLVTKNAILLIDYTNFLRREQGMDREDALRQAGPVRLRPILMTAFSTIAGMLPVAIGLGEGAETRAPMGTAIVGGMITSTILTLVVIPVVYSIMDDFGLFCGRLFSQKDESQEVAEPQVDEPIPEIGIAALVHEQ